MADSKAIIDQLEQSIRRLVKAHSEALKELRELRAQNAAQAEKIRNLTIEQRDLTSEVERLQSSDIFAGGPRTKAARRQVNRLLREVDECIALLTSKE